MVRARCHEFVMQTWARMLRSPAMPKRKTHPAAGDAAYENFLYLLAEMERALERGTIQWTPASAQSAQRRLVNMFAELGVIAVRLGEE
jgi:hypothetical protein